MHSWRPGGDPSDSCLLVLGFGLSPDFLIVQMNWEAVLELAMDAQKPEEYSSSDPADPQNSAIRRHAIAVMDAVDRNGLVAPWTAVPHLLALTTDPNRCALLGALLRIRPCLGFCELSSNRCPLEPTNARAAQRNPGDSQR